MSRPVRKARKWDRILPILGRDVIDLRYDLPLPFGIGVTYANVKQDNLLSDIEVGIDGRPKEPFEFVSFPSGSRDSIIASFSFSF